MAEALAIVGSVASILQLIQVTFLTIEKIQYYASTARAIPLALRPTITCLPILLSHLEKLKQQPLTGKNELLQVLNGFHNTVMALERDIVKVLPLKGDSRMVRFRKAIRSLRADEQIRLAEMAIEKYKTTLILCLPPHNNATGCIDPARRGKFFSYWKFNYPEPVRQIAHTNEYREMASSLLLRKGEVKGTSVVILPIPNQFYTCLAVASLCQDMRTSGLAEVIIHLQPGIDWVRSASNYHQWVASHKMFDLGIRLDKLGINTSYQQDGRAAWDVLIVILEQWQRKWLLVLDMTTMGDFVGEDVTEVQYLMENLPKSKNGHVLVVCQPGSSTHEYGANMDGPIFMKTAQCEGFSFTKYYGILTVETE